MQKHRRLDERDDLTLLAAAAGGDHEGFDELVSRHQAAVHRFARSLSTSEAEAEEVLQRCFIAAWRGAAGFRGAGSARSWLFTIARNEHRRIHRLRAGEPSEHVEISTLGCEAGWGSAEPLAERIERRDWLTRALQRLGDGDQLVLLLVDVEGATAREAAAAMDVSEAALKSRLHRARLRLMAALREEVDDDS